MSPGDNYKARELMLCAQIGNQIIETDIEKPEHFKPLFLYANNLHQATI